MKRLILATLAMALMAVPAQAHNTRTHYNVFYHPHNSYYELLPIVGTGETSGGVWDGFLDRPDCDVLTIPPASTRHFRYGDGRWQTYATNQGSLHWHRFAELRKVNSSSAELRFMQWNNIVDSTPRLSIQPFERMRDGFGIVYPNVIRLTNWDWEQPAFVFKSPAGSSGCAHLGEWYYPYYG